MYSFEQLMNPIWSSNIIYDESLTMVKSNGIAEAPLLYTPQEVLSVTSADKTIEYEQGKDWELSGNMFKLTKNSRIFAFEDNELIFDKVKPNKCFLTVDGKYSLFHEGHFFHDRQISITYKRMEGGCDFIVDSCDDMMPRMMEKLRNKKELTIVLYGDSIAEGANSSGRALTTPFLPTWGNLFVEKLRRHYNTKINLVNTSKGGKNSYWAIENAKEKVADFHPDVALIAFGMNDSDKAEKFVENIKKIKDTIIQSSPLTEFILCATTVPNRKLKNFYKYQGEYRDALMELREKGTVIADFYSMQKYLLKRKRFIDLTGNNVNHPNDFMIRCHAQLLTELFISTTN